MRPVVDGPKVRDRRLLMTTFGRLEAVIDAHRPRVDSRWGMGGRGGGSWAERRLSFPQGDRTTRGRKAIGGGAAEVSAADIAIADDGGVWGDPASGTQSN